MRVPKHVLLAMFAGILLQIPGIFGNWLRYQYYRSKLRYLGENVRIGVGVEVMYNSRVVSIGGNSCIDNYVIIEGYEKEVTIGKHVHVAPFCVIQGGDQVVIGDYVGISAGCKIYSASESYQGGKRMTPMVPNFQRNVIQKPVIIEKDAFLGANTVVLPGVRIGEGAIVGANSLVMNDVPPWTIVAGSPSKPLKKRPRLSI